MDERWMGWRGEERKRAKWIYNILQSLSRESVAQVVKGNWSVFSLAVVEEARFFLFFLFIERILLDMHQHLSNVPPPPPAPHTARERENLLGKGVWGAEGVHGRFTVQQKQQR